MNTTAIEAGPKARNDLRDTRNDRLFRLVLGGTVVLVMLALAAAALSIARGAQSWRAQAGSPKCRGPCYAHASRRR